MVFNDREYIAKKIKMARKKARLTQEELAEKVGITAKQISRIEIGTYSPSLATFLKIVNILSIDITEFGINTDLNNNNNETRDKLIKLIYNATDSEIEFYYSIFNTITQNIALIKNEKIKV